MRLRFFVLLTACGFVVFALTMTFAPVMPVWANVVARATLLVALGALWRAGRDGHRLSRFRPVLFAWLAAVVGLSLGFFLADRGLDLLGLTTRTPVGIAVAKLLQAALTVIGILAVAGMCGESRASLCIRKGRLLLGLGVGAAAAAVLLALALLQPAVRALGAARLASVAPWVLIFVASNALMEELLFRGLFLGRLEPLIGRWPALLSTGLAFTLAHVQVTYAPELLFFLAVTFAFSIAWGWLMQRTGSIWGSALFHAGADLLLVMPIFSSLGAA